MPIVDDVALRHLVVVRSASAFPPAPRGEMLSYMHEIKLSMLSKSSGLVPFGQYSMPTSQLWNAALSAH
jgi:hypothetical protein